MRLLGPDLDVAAFQFLYQKIAQRQNMLGDGGRVELIDIGQGLGQAGGPEILGHTVDLEPAGVRGQGQGEKGRQPRVAKIAQPAFRRLGQREQAVRQARFDLLLDCRTNVEQPDIKRRVQPFLGTCGQEIDAQLGNIKRQGAQLLNGVHHQKTAPLFGQV